jgi:hypothetical protein
MTQAKSGNIEMVQWLQQQYSAAVNDYAMKGAAALVRLLCAYLHSQQLESELSEDACNAAAQHGHVETLVWLFQQGYLWSVDNLRRSAAQGGSIPLMRYLQQQGIVSTVAQLTNMLRCAGAHNRLQAAQWLRQQGADWPAALNIRMDMEWGDAVLAWARAEGCTAPVMGQHSGTHQAVQWQQW